MRSLTQKQENFTLNLFKDMTQRESWIQAGYSSKYPLPMIDSHACSLANKDKIKVRLAELRAEAAQGAVMSRQEILERHSEIARAKITDFQTAGADGSWIDIGPENKHAGAIQEITSKTEYDKDGSSPSVVMKVKLHDPVRSMQEIARLQGHYPKEDTNITYNDIKVLIVREKPREALQSTRSPLEIEGNSKLREDTETNAI